MKLRTCLYVLLALLADGSLLAAQRITSPYSFLEKGQSLGPVAGYFITDRGSIPFGPKAGPLFGVRYGIRLNGPLSAEAQVSYFPTERSVLDTSFVGKAHRSVGTVPMRLLLSELGFRFNLTGARTWNKIAPFVFIGGGVALDVAPRDTLNNRVGSDVRYKFGTSFAGVLGTGAELYLSQSLGIRGDARATLWQIKTPGGFRVRDVTVAPQEWTQNVQLSGSVAYHF
jgi:hypothetical protein